MYVCGGVCYIGGDGDEGRIQCGGLEVFMIILYVQKISDTLDKLTGLELSHFRARPLWHFDK